MNSENVKKSSLHQTLLILALLSFATSAFAQQVWCGHPIPPPEPPPSDPPGAVCEPTECCKCNKSPNFIAAGVYETGVADLQVAATSGAIVSARRYSSGNYADGALGIGWRSGFGSKIHLTSYKTELVLISDAPGEPLYQYRTTQYLAVLTSPEGGQYHFLGAYRTQHLLQEQISDTFTAPLGRYDTLIRRGDGVYELTWQRSRAKAVFGSDGLIVTAADEFGNTLQYTYDGSARLTQISDLAGSGRSMTITWGANGRISSIQDSAGRQVLYGYNPDGMLSSVIDPAGRVTSYSYGPGSYAPRLTQIKDHWNRVITDITWSTTGETAGMIQSYSENGETYTYTNNIRSLETVKQDSAGNSWTYRYVEGSGLVNWDFNPEGAGKSTTYNADGSITHVRDEVLIDTGYTYYANGAIASVTRAGDVRFEYSYDPIFTEKVSVVRPVYPHLSTNHPNFQGWRYDYYPSGSAAPGALHHVYRVRDDGVTTDTVATYTYDSRGRVLSVTDGSGGVTDYAYDPTGNLTTVTAPANNSAGTRPVTSYGYDSAGRVTSVTDPLGQVSSYTYDALDRILTVTLPKPVTGSPLNFVTTYSYDNFESASGLTFTHVTDPNGALTKQGYDQLGRLRKSIDALGNATTYNYTGNRLTSVTDANNNVTSYEYFKGRLAATVFPDGSRETYTYYNDNQLKTKTDRKNQTITYEYDYAKRLSKKIYPNGTYIRYTYHGQKLIEVYDTSVSPAETHTFSYDSSFRLTSNTQATRGTIGYSYIPSDAVATMTVTGGPTTNYSYYPDGSLDTIVWSPVSGQFKYNYRLNGQYQTITFPNGQTRNFAYDNQGRVTQISNLHPTAGNLATYDYAYDLNHATGTYTMLGQRVSMTANVPAQGFTNALHKYYYDANYQLTRVDYPAAVPFNGEVHSWTYDAIGNRLSSTVNGTTTSYAYQKIGTNPLNWQRLTSDGVNSYSYDANGSAITRGGDSFGWDYESRMNSVSGETTASYKYDYQGRRASRTTGATTTYLYDDWNLVSETGTTNVQFLFGASIDEPLASVEGTTVRYYTVDSLGSVATLNDAAGSVQNGYAFDAWGSIRNQTGMAPNPFGYTAREFAEAGLAFYRARHYQPGIGRFTSEDPLGFGRAILPVDEFDPVIAVDVGEGGEEWTSEDSFSEIGVLPMYSYVFNSPLMYTDPSGEQAQAAKALAQALAKVAKLAWKKCKDIRCKPPEYHGPHHKFFGKPMCHVQLNCWIKGKKASKFVIRVPFPCTGKYKPKGPKPGGPGGPNNPGQPGGH